MREWTWEHPDGNLSPLDYIYMVDKTWLYPPGKEKVYYSSVGYMILGLILA